jgi:hypothetical protein
VTDRTGDLHQLTWILDTGKTILFVTLSGDYRFYEAREAWTGKTLTSDTILFRGVLLDGAIKSGANYRQTGKN